MRNRPCDSSPTCAVLSTNKRAVGLGRAGLLVLALIASGCGNAADEPAEPVAQTAQALCPTGTACTGYNGGCSGTGVCNASGTCVVSVWCSDGNPCTIDQCFTNFITGSKYCTHTGTTGGTCNDGNACTQTDTCQSGVCTGGNLKVCTPLSQCHVAGTCNTSTGVCSNPTKSNGVTCNDGSACTTGDTCQYGSCTGTAVNCNDSNACTTDSCSPSSGCQHGTVYCEDDYDVCTVDYCDPAYGCRYDPISCDDNNACTSDGCSATAGCTHSGINCNDNNACTVDGCNASTGCTHAVRNCNDNNACTNDGCNTSTGCTYTSVNCDDGNPCTVDGCNSSSGCTHTFASTATACNDGKFCTRNDHCDGAGQCTGSDNCEDADLCTDDGCAADGSCYHVNTVVCNGQNQCQQAGYCDGNTGSCVYPPKADGTTCDDNLRCTNNDKCQGGACQGTAVVCSPLSQCHVAGACDPATGACSNPTKSDGVACDDGNWCSASSACQGGNCVGANWTSCPGDECNYAGSCDPASGACISSPKPAGTSCIDWNKCNENDQCDGNGYCAGSGQKVCSDDNPCTADACVPYTGCEFFPQPPGYECDDGNHCTSGDYCTSGACYPGIEVRCSDDNPCTVDDCVPASGCRFQAAPPSTTCDDGNACTVGDHCNGANACLSGSSRDCNDNDVCTTDGCDQSSGCTHAQISCVDANECTLDTCDPVLGCQHVARSCDDGDVCTIDGCNASSGCTHAAVSCDDGNSCTADSCVRSTGCVHEMLGTSVACNDGSLCTAGDHCDGAGHCVATTVTQCNDGVVCTLDNCDPATGTCLHPPAPTSRLCDDGNGCTSGDHCDGLGGCAEGAGCSNGDAVDGDELCDSEMSCKPGKMGDPVLKADEVVIERRLGTGRHPVAVSPQRYAVAFVELMKDMEAAPRIGVATFDHFGVSKGAGRFDASVIDSGPVIAGLPGGGFALAYASMGEPGGDGLDVVLREVSADGVMGATRVIANDKKTLGQRAPDLLWAGDRLVVGWEDESLAGVRRVCWREFSDKLAPLGVPECNKDLGTASSLTMAASGTDYAIAWRKEGSSPSVELELRAGGRLSFALGEASSAGAPALAAVGSEWMLVYTEGCGVQQSVIVSDTGEVLSQTPLGTGTPERYEPSIAVTQAGIYVSWREPAQLVGGVWDAKLDEVYLQQHTWANNLLTAGARVPVPAGTVLLQGDQANAAIASLPDANGVVLVAAWEDWNPNVADHSKHGEVLVSLIVTPVVR